MIALINDLEVAVRGADIQQLGMFSYESVEECVPADYPVRKLRVLVDTIPKELDELLYAPGGRISIPPERLLWASLLQVVYSVRRERLLMEQLNYHLLFRWFVGLNIDDPVGSFHVLLQPRPVVRCGDRPAVLCANSLVGPTR